MKPASKPRLASVEQPFGCGWRRQKGGEAELRAFVEERRSLGRA